MHIGVFPVGAPLSTNDPVSGSVQAVTDVGTAVIPVLVLQVALSLVVTGASNRRFGSLDDECPLSSPQHCASRDGHVDGRGVGTGVRRAATGVVGWGHDGAGCGAGSGNQGVAAAAASGPLTLALTGRSSYCSGNGDSWGWCGQCTQVAGLSAVESCPVDEAWLCAGRGIVLGTVVQLVFAFRFFRTESTPEGAVSPGPRLVDAEAVRVGLCPAIVHGVLALCGVSRQGSCGGA